MGFKYKSQAELKVENDKHVARLKESIEAGRKVIQQDRHDLAMKIANKTAADYGNAFVIFVAGFANNVFLDVGAARDSARSISKSYGRENVRIKCIKV